MNGYYITDKFLSGILDGVIYLDYQDAEVAQNKYFNSGRSVLIKSICVKGTELVMDLFVENDLCKNDPNGIESYIRKTMLDEIAKKLNLKLKKISDLNLSGYHEANCHFRGSIELPKDCLNTTK